MHSHDEHSHDHDNEGLGSDHDRHGRDHHGHDHGDHSDEHDRHDHHQHGHDQHGGDEYSVEHSDEHRALSRVVDRVADRRDWRLLERRARDDAGLWRRLAEWLRDDDELRAAVDDELLPTETVTAPVFARRRWWSGLPHWSGWAAAVLLALAWSLSPDTADSRVERRSSDGGAGSTASAPIAAPFARPVAASVPDSVPDIDRMLRNAGGTPGGAHGGERPVATADRASAAGPALSGMTLSPSAPTAELLGELPAELLSTRPLPDGGGVEVFTLRRVLQREVLTGVYELGSDELGNPRPVPVRPGALLSSDLY